MTIDLTQFHDAFYEESAEAIGQMENVLKHLRRILAPRVECGASDGELLERFFVSRDEAAFELLVWRYHRMVLGVCSRILADSNQHQAPEVRWNAARMGAWSASEKASTQVP